MTYIGIYILQGLQLIFKKVLGLPLVDSHNNKGYLADLKMTEPWLEAKYFNWNAYKILLQKSKIGFTTCKGYDYF
jgi:hypothetical protein